MQEYGGYGSYGGYQTPPGDGGYPTSPWPQSPPPPPPPPPRPGMWRYLVVAVTAAAIGAGTVLAVGHSSLTPTASPQPQQSSPAAGQQPNGGGQGNGNGNGLQPNGGNTGLGNSAQAVFNKVSPGLVIINTALHYNSEAAAGTGMVLTSDGLVLTNNHVISGATSISATVLATGKRYVAKVLGYDQTGDIAALQLLQASGLRTIPVGNSDTVKVGDAVLAMGNAQGQSQIQPAQGRVTALNQTVTASDANNPDGRETLHGTIESDAAIVSGDSGGALANASGQVIGMNTAGNDGGIATGQPTGFAIPINTATDIVHQIASGQASSAVTIGLPTFIGIFDVGGTSSSDPQAQAQQQNQGFPFGGSGNGNQQSCVSSQSDLQPLSSIAPVGKGTLVAGVICQGPVAKAGIVAGDVITAVNGQSVGGPNDLQSQLAKFKVGDSVSLTWADLNGHSHTGQIQLVAGPPK